MKKGITILLLLTLVLSVSGQTNPDSVKRVLENEKNDSLRFDALYTLAAHYVSRNLSQSVDYAEQAIALSKQMESIEFENTALGILAIGRYYQGNYEEALDNWLASIELLIIREDQEPDSLARLNLMKARAQLLNNAGAAYKNLGQYDEAIEYYQQNLQIQEQLGNLYSMAQSKANIANVYFAFELDYDKVLEYYNESLEDLNKHLIHNPDDQQGKQLLAGIYLNIGIACKEIENDDMAIENFQRALDMFTELDNKAGIANALNSIGLVYLAAGSYQEALDASMNALEVYREIGQRKEEAGALKNIGHIYYKWKRYSEALSYMNQSLKLSREMNLKREMFDVYKDMSNVYRDIGDYRQALQNYELYNVLKDSSIREENLQAISELETKYNTERVERENSELNFKNQLQEAGLKRQRIILFSVIGIAMIILGFGFITYRQFLAKKKANILLEEQNIEIKQQRDQIFQQKQEITDSIHYASRIQEAILPRDTMLSKLQDHFILFKPRDIVSGDYYWMTLKDSKTIVAAADCTGHGVPGAFMSMLGISFMNEIVNRSDTTQANEILNELRTHVVESLGQTGQEGEQQDGMDLALCVIDMKAKKVQYSGAYNPLYLIRNKEMIEYKPDKMPIGIHRDKKEPFSNNLFDVEIGDALYMFSDGYVDQFGGPKQKKFMSKNFKDLLLEIHEKPMEEQKEILNTTIEDWMGKVEQIDDILVMGMRI